MVDLNAYVFETEVKKLPPDLISLTGHLEVYVGNYFVLGEGGRNQNWRWLTVYYDAEIDPKTEAVETIPQNIVAYVSSDYCWGFVLAEHFQKFTEDTKSYDIVCIPVPSFQQELLHCFAPASLPKVFSDILWIDDDFLYDVSLPFDMDSFSVIDGGVDYLNPKHFSVDQFVSLFET